MDDFLHDEKLMMDLTTRLGLYFLIDAPIDK